MTQYNRPTVVWALEELSNRNEQTRLWLSDGSSGEVSSFSEAVCVVFDGGVTMALDSGEIPTPLNSLFTELRNLIKKIPADVHPDKVINHPLMSDVRRVSLALLQRLEEERCQGAPG